MGLIHIPNDHLHIGKMSILYHETTKIFQEKGRDIKAMESKQKGREMAILPGATRECEWPDWIFFV